METELVICPKTERCALKTTNMVTCQHKMPHRRRPACSTKDHHAECPPTCIQPDIVLVQDEKPIGKP
jgi:hypothetical protein